MTFWLSSRLVLVSSPCAAFEKTDWRSTRLTSAPTLPAPVSSWIGAVYSRLVELPDLSSSVFPCSPQTRGSGCGRLAGRVDAEFESDEFHSALLERNHTGCRSRSNTVRL